MKMTVSRTSFYLLLLAFGFNVGTTLAEKRDNTLNASHPQKTQNTLTDEQEVTFFMKPSPGCGLVTISYLDEDEYGRHRSPYACLFLPTFEKELINVCRGREIGYIKGKDSDGYSSRGIVLEFPQDAIDFLENKKRKGFNGVVFMQRAYNIKKFENTTQYEDDFCSSINFKVDIPEGKVAPYQYDKIDSYETSIRSYQVFQNNQANYLFETSSKKLIDPLIKSDHNPYFPTQKRRKRLF